MKRIAFIARTSGLEYDDRIRKECNSLKEFADLQLFINFKDNHQETGMTGYNIPYKAYHLRSRDIFPSGKFLLIKALEFYIRIIPRLAEFDVIWVHETYAFMFSLLAKKNSFIWDLHELPCIFMPNKFRKKVFKYIEQKSLFVIHANEGRINYLQHLNMVKDKCKHISIRNYPDYTFADQNINKIIRRPFDEWVEGYDYVYLQGLGKTKRYPYETLSAIIESNLKAVVIGPFSDEMFNKLYEKYGHKFKKNIYFTGMVNQLDIPTFQEGAMFSMIFYDMDYPNNKYCEPNRLYQAIIKGLPVIVGCNPTMKEVVEKYKFGVVLHSDGRNLNDIKEGIKILKDSLEVFKANVQKNSGEIMWDTQEKIFKKIFKKIQL